jgi:hypothetical protein
MKTIKRIIRADAIRRFQWPDLREPMAAMRQRNSFAILQGAHE